MATIFRATMEDERSAAAPAIPRSVAIFSQRMSRGPSGNVVAALSKGFRDAGVERIYLAYLENGPRPVSTDGITTVRLGARRSSLAILPLVRFLRRFRPELFIALPAIPNMAAAMAWLLSGRVGKFIASEHSVMSHESWQEHRWDPRLRLLPLLARILYPKASGIHAVSSGVLEDLVRVIGIPSTPDRMVVIPNAVDVERVRQLATETPDQEWLRTPRRIPVALSVGRLVPQKNQRLLVEAVARVIRERPIRLMIIGEGGELPRLRAQVHELGVAEHVYISGRYEQNPYAQMANADLFVLPSQEEGFGLVVVEALACGVPVVATDCAGPREILRNDTGVIVPRGDVDAMSRAISRVLSDDELRARLRRNGDNRVAEFQPESIARRWLRFASSLP